MSGIYRTEFFRLLQTKKVWVICGILWLYFVVQALWIYQGAREQQGIARGFWMQAVISILQKKETVVFVSSMSGIIYAASCMEDFQSKFYKFYLARMDVESYMKGKIIGNLVGVTAVICVAAVLWILAIYLLYEPMETGKIENQRVIEAWQKIVNILITYCGGCLVLSSMAMFFSLTVESVYIAYLTPFVAFFVIYIINQRFLNEIYYLNPYNWFLIEDYLGKEKLRIWGMLFLIYSVWNWLFANRVMRRVCSE